MKNFSLRILLLTFATLPLSAAEAWRTLFNGKDLSGWKANAYPDSWSVVDGAIRAHATKESSHLFYVGDQKDGFERFKDFELEVIARSEPNSNSGVFIHTDYATQTAALRLSKGYEIQLNSSAREPRKTGSLYAVVDLAKSPVDESKWFSTLITVRGKRITIQIEGNTVVDYTEPENVERPPGRADRKLDPKGGAIALQAHDPGSTFYFKSVRIRTLEAGSSPSTKSTSSYTVPAPATPPFYQVYYPASSVPGELVFPVAYRIWIPPGVKTLRGVIVHQHGCGEGACKGGETAADDLHWQALAKKWDCALLGPSYQQPESAPCALWCDPRNGSEKTFLRALTDLGQLSGHAELARVPWTLWGHSGGAQWVGTLLLLQPERIVAVWLRSGAPRLVPMAGSVVPIETPAAALAVPVMANPGAKEKTHERFKSAWNGALGFFQATRARGGLIGFAPDPRTGHECGDSRYLAIPFFDACLEQRLPAQPGSGQLRPMNPASAWLAPLHGDAATPAAQFSGVPNEAVWLPNAAVAKAWSDYVKTGATSDDTPPPAPTALRISANVLTWNAASDFESGLSGFIIERDGAEMARIPEKPVGQFGRALFQRMSFHDTPSRPLPEMRFTIPDAASGKHRYQVRSINSVGLISERSAAAAVN